MFKARLFVLLALVVLTAGFAVAASASAEVDHWLVCSETKEGNGKYKNHECKVTGGKENWEKTPIQVGEAHTFFGEGINAKIETPKFTIRCTAEASEGNLEGAGKSVFFTSFAGCSVVAEPECKVTNTGFGFEGVLPGISTGGVDPNDLTLLTGSRMTISGCSIAGEYKFAGTQICNMPKLVEMAEKHEMACKPAGSEIELESGGSKEKGVTYTVTEVLHLVADPFWGAER